MASSINFEKKEKKNVSKILFTGLDNSGKSSIIMALQREYSKIAMLKPTRQAQRKIFEYMGKEISEWDLGGQKRYRIAYLKEPTKYFDNTSICIYVIDVQDFERLGESLSYFKDVVKEFVKLGLENLTFHIFFHKVDPNYMKRQSLIKINGQITDLKDKISKIIDGKYPINFFKTTIYQLWTIISAFSEILLNLFPQSELIDKTLEEFARKIHGAEAILILDPNSLVIGQYFKTERAKEILSASTPYFLTLNESLHPEGIHDSENSMTLQKQGKIYYFDNFKVKRFKRPLYLLMMNNEEYFPEEDITSFKDMIESILT